MVVTGPPQTITALSFNLYLLVILVAVSSLTRTVPLRLLLLLVCAGGASLGICVFVEKVLLIPAIKPISWLAAPIIEETLKLSPVLLILFAMRRFSLWTLGLTDFLLLGAASGAGFAFIYDAASHSKIAWRHDFLSWLPFTDATATGHIVSGHMIWTAIAASSLGLSLLCVKSRRTAVLVALSGVVWCILDRSAIELVGDRGFVSGAANIVTANGYASIVVFSLLLAVAIALDLIRVSKFIPASVANLDVPELRPSGMSAVWNFMLERRRLANANFHRTRSASPLGSTDRQEITTAVLTQTLINDHSPEIISHLLRPVTGSLSSSNDGAIFSDDDDDGVLLSAPLKLPPQYILVSSLSKGGMGTVYKGRHAHTDAALAIKILNKETAGKGSNRERFQMEAKTTSRLSHPNLVVIHDYGITDSEIPYIVMEFIDGKTLQQEIGVTKGLPPQRFFRIFEQVLDGLAHAHQKGVVHRDIKPSNIVLVRDSDDFIKIVDFGIAKNVESNGLQSQQLTQTGDIIGSPLYMSPEQCMGDKLDHRSDIYSLGCVMYEAISGRPPLYGENVVKTIFKQINVLPEPISRIRPELNIPSELEQIIFKAVAKDPEERFADIPSMRNALRAFKDSMLPR